MSKRLKRIICWSLALAFMAGSGLLGYLMAANAPSVLKEEEIEAAQEEERIGIDCIVTKEYRYTVCGHKEQEESAVDRELVSMTEEEVEAHFPEFAIQSFSADRLELVRRIPQYCPKHYVLKRLPDPGKDGGTEGGRDLIHLHG